MNLETFEDLAQLVASEFKEVIDEEGFDDFNDMADCYQWSADDIKAEVDYYLQNATDGDACLSDDGLDVYFHGTNMMISYRTFSKMWRRKLVKA